MMITALITTPLHDTLYILLSEAIEWGLALQLNSVSGVVPKETQRS